MIKQMLTYDEAAKYLKTSPRTVRRLVRDGKIGVVRLSYKSVVIPIDDLTKLIEGNYEKTEGVSNTL